MQNSYSLSNEAILNSDLEKITENRSIQKNIFDHQVAVKWSVPVLSRFSRRFDPSLRSEILRSLGDLFNDIRCT